MSVPAQLTTDEVIASAVAALKTKTPWLCLRLGDGEELALRSVGHPNKSEIENIPWNKHLGIIPTDEEKQQWIDLTKLSIGAADLVGLHASDSTQGLQFRTCGEVLRANLDNVKRECAANIHLHLLYERKYDKILEAAQGVWLFTGHPLAKPFRAGPWRGRNPKCIKWFCLPLQCRYFNQKSSWAVWRDGIIPEISKLPDMKGFLVLVGGGIPGKAIMAPLRERGGVVLDIGSVFDRWAGFATRGKGKGVGARNETWALSGTVS